MVESESGPILANVTEAVQRVVGKALQPEWAGYSLPVLPFFALAS